MPNHKPTPRRAACCQAKDGVGRGVLVAGVKRLVVDRRVKIVARKDAERIVGPVQPEAEDAASGDFGRRDAAIAFDTSRLGGDR